MHRFVGILGLLPAFCVCATPAHADIFSFIVEEDEQTWTSVTTAFGGIYATRIEPSSDDAPVTFATGRVIYFESPAACLGDRDALNTSILTPLGLDLTPINRDDQTDALNASARVAAALADTTPVSLTLLPNDMSLIDPDHGNDPALAGLGSEAVNFTDAPIRVQEPVAIEAE